MSPRSETQGFFQKKTIYDKHIGKILFRFPNIFSISVLKCRINEDIIYLYVSEFIDEEFVKFEKSVQERVI